MFQKIIYKKIRKILKIKKQIFGFSRWLKKTVFLSRFFDLKKSFKHLGNIENEEIKNAKKNDLKMSIFGDMKMLKKDKKCTQKY